MTGVKTELEPSPTGGPAGPPSRAPALEPSLVRERQNALGTFLQARRALVTPDQVGITPVGRRRVAGLRREEVALLAGISVDYYLRLERGRDRNPSSQVVEALGRVLQLDDELMAHLRVLAAQAPRPVREPHERETPPTSTLALLKALTQPAFLEDRNLDIVASNEQAQALSPRLAPGGNQLRDVFLDVAEQHLHPDWDEVTACLVAGVRKAASHTLDHPRLGELVAQLLRESPRFRQLWGRHEVRGQYGAPLRIAHPRVGEMTLHRERLAVAGTDGLTLVVFHADAGSVDAERLDSLVGTASR